MRHLRKFNESTDLSKEDLLDNFVYITDKLGQPEVFSQKYVDSKKWTFIWKLGLDVSDIQEAPGLINKLKDIVEELDDIVSASERLTDWNFNMSLTDVLRIEMLPKESGSDEFEFIKKYDSRCLYIRASEIERFFAKRGCTVAKWDLESSYNEYSERNDLEVYLSKPNVEATSELSNLITAELEQKKDQIEREYVAERGQKYFAIRSYDEKSYVDLV